MLSGCTATIVMLLNEWPLFWWFSGWSMAGLMFAGRMVAVSMLYGLTVIVVMLTNLNSNCSDICWQSKHYWHPKGWIKNTFYTNSQPPRCSFYLFSPYPWRCCVHTKVCHQLIWLHGWWGITAWCQAEPWPIWPQMAKEGFMWTSGPKRQAPKDMPPGL